ncbi:MAG TPA: hypothetical protein VID67_06420 [Rhizomicrobium sp.]
MAEAFLTRLGLAFGLCGLGGVFSILRSTSSRLGLSVMAKRDLANSSFMAGFTESYLADIGRIIAAWSHVEQQFDLLFLSVVVMENKGRGSMKDPRVKMMGEAFERRIRRFREAVIKPNFPEKTTKALETTLGRLTQLRTERDTLAHATFGLFITPERKIDPERAMATIKSWRNEKEHEMRPITQAYLKKTFSKIHALYWEMFDLSLQRPWSVQPPRRP